MGSALVLAALAANALVSLIRPWIGVIFAYTVTLLAPQAIWWWSFDGVRASFWATLPVLVGCLLHAVLGKLGYRVFWSPLNAAVAALWLFMTLSYYFGAYASVVGAGFYDAQYMFATLQKSFLAYMVASLLIDTPGKLRLAVMPILVTVTYMTYWANSQYFSGSQFGRIGGPKSLDGLGIYADENNFAVLFVIGVPFLIYLGRYYGGIAIQAIMWLITLLAWHAVFLTGSRGGLLGLAAVLGMFTLRSKKKHLGLIAMAAFVLAFVWQGGDVMKSRMATLSEYEEESSASSRLEAWEAASGMMAKHPALGVGFASFGRAFPDFSDSKPRDAHNTFFQIGAEWGVAAAILYVWIIAYTLLGLRRSSLQLSRIEAKDAWFLRCMSDACLLSLFGFSVCSMFLSLQAYEVFYFLLLLSNATIVLTRLHFRREHGIQTAFNGPTVRGNAG